MEKFIFKRFPGFESVDINLIDLLVSHLDKNDSDLIKVFKERLSSKTFTSHGEILTRTPGLIIMQFSLFSKNTNNYRDHKLMVFHKELTGEWTLNRFII